MARRGEHAEPVDHRRAAPEPIQHELARRAGRCVEVDAVHVLRADVAAGERPHRPLENAQFSLTPPPLEIVAVDVEGFVQFRQDRIDVFGSNTARASAAADLLRSVQMGLAAGAGGDVRMGVTRLNEWKMKPSATRKDRITRTGLSGKIEIAAWLCCVAITVISATAPRRRMQAAGQRHQQNGEADRDAARQHRIADGLAYRDPGQT